MKKYHLLLLSVLSGLLLAMAWPARGFPGLLFIGFVPLLFIEDFISSRKQLFSRFSFLFYSYPAFLTWNALTTWWIYNSTGVGAILAIALNSMFMSIVFHLFHFSGKKIKLRTAKYACLVFYWISFEYLHLNWIVNWPWLNLGNGFSSYYQWVQWYEYTGTMGGTLWVLIANILVYFLILVFAFRFSPFAKKTSPLLPRQKYLFLSMLIIWISIPLLLSYIIFQNYEEEKNPVNIVIVQPNVDPYSEQYILPPGEVIGRIMNLAGSALDSSVNFLVAPESAIQERMWENNLGQFNSIRLLKNIIDHYPKLNIVIGGSTFYEFKNEKEITRTARRFSDTNAYYDAYNTAILINAADSIQLYHKSKLTPGVESLPSFKGFKWIEKFAIDLGGTVGSLGTDKIRKVFQTEETVKASPAICYESIFGEFFAEYVRHGAQIMFIITNDGWWGNTAGHRQHYEFSHLRAIETRRSIARSANTGISAFIDQRGDAHQVTDYWEPAVIKGTLNASTKLTFYVKHGDYVARIAVICSLITLLGSFIMSITGRRNYTLNE